MELTVQFAGGFDADLIIVAIQMFRSKDIFAECIQTSTPLTDYQITIVHGWPKCLLHMDDVYSL
ncbi:hypothetical protein EA473_07605 [Natrarchaeobius chitinivorans]|uniref:Uncharacterized protein n=1 Tax=Natrarchaeobius chitinivorans TaxID=1679083 RepID=A0A3N6MJK8_NATCH|nr:hypothetical protein EA473_07605 [Natrarchaeobius chitinivorans]